MMVSSATDIPAEALGIRLSNPTSVEAINAAEQRLSRIAERQNREFTRQLMQLMRVAIYMQGGYQSLSDVDLSGITPVWEPVNVSVKAWESKQRAQNTLDAIRQSVNQPEQGQAGTATADTGTGDTQQSSAKPSETGASELKTAFDALGVAIRAGVSPQSAAAKLGLDGIDFTGMVPVSLRDDSKQ